MNDADNQVSAAYVLVKGGDAWTHQATLYSDAPSARDQFGAAVALANDMAADEACADCLDLARRHIKRVARRAGIGAPPIVTLGRHDRTPVYVCCRDPGF